jgi:hypothetical protein
MRRPCLLFNDFDYDVGPEPLIVTKINGQASLVGQPVSLQYGGIVIVNANGSLQYTPAAAFVGQETFSYTVSDGLASDTATVTLVATNYAPEAHDDYYEVVQGDPLSLGEGDGLLFNDFDYDDDPLVITAVNGLGSAVGNQITLASGATLTVNADGSFTYTPAVGFLGEDSFTYTIFDGVTYATATVFINVLEEEP